jgi:hypothetical protein
MLRLPSHRICPILNRQTNLNCPCFRESQLDHYFQYKIQRHLLHLEPLGKKANFCLSIFFLFFKRLKEINKRKFTFFTLIKFFLTMLEMRSRVSTYFLFISILCFVDSIFYE